MCVQHIHLGIVCRLKQVSNQLSTSHVGLTHEQLQMKIGVYMSAGIGLSTGHAYANHGKTR